MAFFTEHLWGILYYAVPGCLLGLGLSLRGNLSIERPKDHPRMRSLSGLALGLGWSLLAATLLAQGLGALFQVGSARVFGVCLILDVTALAAGAACLGFPLWERHQERL